jgi:hypothetical protein
MPPRAINGVRFRTLPTGCAGHDSSPRNHPGGRRGWALTALECGNWHPLTWLSLQADRQPQGPEPGHGRRRLRAAHPDAGGRDTWKASSAEVAEQGRLALALSVPEPGLVRLSFRSPESREVRWKVRFDPPPGR